MSLMLIYTKYEWIDEALDKSLDETTAWVFRGIALIRHYSFRGKVA